VKSLHQNMRFGAAIVLLGLCACTSNPFGGDEIQRPVYNTITGHLDLSDNAMPDSIYVWLAGTGISARTDRSGNFQLSLPSTGSNGSSASGGGVFNLYFYVANYKISQAKVVTRNNEFLFAQGDLDAEGRLLGARRLLKLLHIRSRAFPDRISSDYGGPVDILMTLQAALDSVTVVLPKVVGGLLGGIVLKEKQTGKLIYSIPDIDAKTRLVTRVGTEPHSWRMVLNVIRGQFPPGQYEIIPYVLVQQDEVPPELLQSLGSHVEEIGADFLRIPVKLDAGELVIGGSLAGR